MTHHRRYWLPAVILFLILTPFAFHTAKAQFQPHVDTLQDAWKLAERAGRYRFTSQMTQTTLPAPRLSNVGQTVKSDHLTVQGAIDRGTDTLDLAIWDSQAAAFDPETALEIHVKQGKAQGRVPGGEWQDLEDVTDAFAPGGDVAAYLLAARHVSFLGTERRTIIPTDETVISHRYRFSINGEALAQFVAAQLEDQLRRKGELPVGLHLSFSDTFSQLVGSGEAWIDDDGLPQRMTVEIEFPQQQNGERVLVRVQTDFSDFDRSLLSLGGAGVSNRLRAGLYNLTQALDGVQMAATAAILLFLFGAVILLIRLPSHKRRLVVSLAVLCAMLTVEIAKAAPLPASLYSSSSLGNPDVVQAAPAQKPLPPPTPEFDSRQAPLDESVPQPQSDPGIYGRAVLDSELDGPDADRDGMPDALESTWGTGVNTPDSDGDGLIDGEEVRRCPDRQAGLAGDTLTGENVTSLGCANPKATDTDGDGLTDKQEALYLGTSINDKDTDGDGLSDDFEVRGFGHNSVMRYTNPLNADTDGDGIFDGIECPNNNCVNSDGAGDPDVFEIDNDGDGFIGSFDLSPNTVLGKDAPFTAANPFQLNVANLNVNKSVFVDFQIRPTNPNHIGFGQSVLDWPTGDTEGQIQRRLTTTFADVNPLPANVAVPTIYPESNGDMRLIPMLEIEIPGSGAPLPRITAAQTVELRSTPLLAAMQIIKQVEPSTLFGFTVEAEALKIRVSKLSADYSNYFLEIHKASCQATLTAPVFPAASLSENGEVTYTDGELAVIADGAHVAVLVAAGLPAQCTPIPKVKDDVTQTPLSFLAPVQEIGTLRLTQNGALSVKVDLTLNNRTGEHQLVLVEGSCQARGNVRGAPLTMLSGQPQNLTDTDLVDLADGAHAVLIRKGFEVLACASLGNVVNGPAGEIEMIDAAAMGKMGITVSEKDSSGALIAHVPLNTAYDTRTGVTSGFAATMFYDTSVFGSVTGGWQHKARMSWWVQMITDNCTTAPDDYLSGQDNETRQNSWCGAGANQVQLVHVYDESWQLAGLSVREEHDYNMDILFEDPATDQNKDADDLLWHLAKGLDELFVSGVDCVRTNAGDGCAQNGQRDVTLTTIYNTFGNTVNGGTSDIDRWGIEASAIHVEQLTTELDTYLDIGKVMQTYAPDLLNQHFLSNGAAVTKAPVLLFASENSFRSVALGTPGYASAQANGATIDFAPGGQSVQPLLTMASLNWAPYRYDTAGQSWTSYPFEEYWDLLALRLKQSADFSATDDQDEGSRLIADGKIRLAQSYFAYLYNGRAAPVQSDGIAIGQWDLNASAYASKQERLQWVIDAGTLSVYVAEGKLVNQVILPIVENINNSARQYQMQQLLISREGTARLGDLNDAVKLAKQAGDGAAEGSTWRTILNGAGDDALDSWFRNYRPGNLSKVGGRITSYGAAGVAGAAIVAGIASSIYAGTQGNGVGAATGVLNGLALAAEVANTVSLLATASKALDAAGDGVKAFTVVRNSLSTTGRALKTASIVGLIIGEIVNYSLLISQISVNGLTIGSLQANQLAATSVAASIVAGMLLVLSTTGVGAILVAILGLIDGLITIICGYLSSEDQASIPGIIFCKGITGWLIELVAFFIYDQNDITQINDPYRLNYTRFNPGLVDPATGFRADAGLTLDLGLRNTLALARLPISPFTIPYFAQFSESNLRSSRFAYDVVPTRPDADAPQIHDGLTRGEGPDPWQTLENDSVTSVYQDVTLIKNNLLRLPLAPGLNQRIPAYLAEGYQVPVQECINTAVLTPLTPIPVCWVRSRGATNYNDLNLKFDVFPATLDEFLSMELAGAEPGRYRQSWSNTPELRFPALIDADGDGLRYDADADDTRWDSDGDGLSDAVEKTRNTRPGDRDSDGDGLWDVNETIWGTDPIDPDSDGDGLSDGEEVMGWSIGYGVDANDTVLLSWTRSDPLSRDIDRDSILDSQEKVYGFNPNIASDPTVLIYKGLLREPKAPLLLIRFDEAAKASTFVDSSTKGDGKNDAACTAGNCPTSGLRGRFGNAVHFDGVDDHLITPPDPRIGNLRTDITLSAWIKADRLTGTQTVIHMGPGGPNGVGGFSFGLQDDDLFLRYEGGGGTFTQALDPGVIPLGQWTQIGVEIYPVEDRLYFYVNGIDKGNQIAILNPASNNPQIVIGAAQRPATDTPPGVGQRRA